MRRDKRVALVKVFICFIGNLIDRGYPQTLIKPSIREGVCTPETQQQRGKTYIYFKRSFNEKMESYTKPTVTSPNF